jgi:uncharacterized protein (TIGR03067 family)
MAAPNRNPNLSPWQWGLIGAGSILMAVVSVFGLWHVMARSPDATIAQPNEQTNLPSKRIIGTWQLDDRLRMLFTPEGKLLMRWESGSIITSQYQLDTNQQPNRIDLFRNGSTSLGIFKFDNDGNLYLNISNPDEPRPTSFDEAYLILEKISDRTNPDFQLSEQDLLQMLIKVGQREATTYVGTLNKGQQAFFIEKNRFSSSIEDLGVGIKPETDNYSYRVRVFDNKRVQTIGIPKKNGLKSFTGGVFVLRVRNTSDVTTVAILCESDHSTKDTPTIPTASSEYTDAQLSCPTGYKEFSPSYDVRSVVSNLNRGQQAFFIEKNRFSSSVEDLGVGIKTETDNYSYKVRVFDNKRVQTMGIAKKDALKSYTGAVFVLRIRNTSDVGTIAILCESDRPTKDIPPIPTASSEYIDAKLSCPSGYTQVVR